MASHIIWGDLQTPDLAGARAFYGALFGWSFSGPDGGYTMATLDGKTVAGLQPLRAGSASPTAWSVYFGVADAAAAQQRAQRLGAKVRVSAMDLGGQGRMAYFDDPAGAPFGIWQGLSHKGFESFGKPGAMTWHETYSRDAAKARAFYSELFGLTAKPLGVPGIDYSVMQDGEKKVCGVMEFPSHFPKELGSHWNSYFEVADPDATAKRIPELGGKLVSPAFDSPMGRLGFAKDPFGAGFNFIRSQA